MAGNREGQQVQGARGQGCLWTAMNALSPEMLLTRVRGGGCLSGIASLPPLHLLAGVHVHVTLLDHL